MIDFKQLYLKIIGKMPKIIVIKPCVLCTEYTTDFICQNCLKLFLKNEPSCNKCSQPFIKGVCLVCRDNVFLFNKAFVPFVYQFPIKQILFNAKRDSYNVANQIFFQYLTNFSLNNLHFIDKLRALQVDVIVYPSISHKKFQTRGFNQAFLIANEISKTLNVELVDIFINTKDKNQKQLTLKERREQDVRFAIKDEIDLTNKNVLLVDDVFTTGATVNELTRLLRAKNAFNVFVFALARAYEKRNIKDII